MASRKITKAIFLLLFAYQNIPEVKSNECTAIISDDITSCATTSIYRQRKDFLAATCRSFTETRSNTTCDRNSFCRQNFKISHFSQMLFSSTMGDSFLTMLRSCCGACAQCHVEHKKLINISQLTPDTINTSDLIFPVLGHDSMDKIYGYHFIPVYKVPNSYYFRLKETGSKKMIKVIYACGRMWPLLIICVLMALISGFITWAMEIRRNPSEFSKPFHVGVFEGFWWGFVSMTTVGYGDKVPKTIPGRLFAIIWILIGITVCSIFTASLTTEIINARKLPNPDLSGKKVGVMVHRMHDTTLVTQHGGIIHQVNISKTTLGIKTMMDLLLEGKHIDGFVMNMNTYYFFKHRRKELAKIIKDKMEKTGKSHDGKQLYTGILVKTKEQYDYFLKYFQTNRLQLESCHDLRLNLKRTEDEDENISLFSPKGALFISFLYYLCAALGLIACFGIVYEFRRNRQKLQQRFERDDGGILYNSLHYLKLDSCYKGTSFNGSKNREETENV